VIGKVESWKNLMLPTVTETSTPAGLVILLTYSGGARHEMLRGSIR
jgi:hypothetical protein